MTLWKTKNEKIKQEDKNLLSLVNRFTVGEDYWLDQQILPFDLIASKTHALALQKMKILNQKEIEILHKGLDEILDLHQKGEFEIKKEQEDCHTAIEQFLTKNYGDVGAKIHTARSRNDQVLTAVRLWQKAKLKKIKTETEKLISAFEAFGKTHKNQKMPGYTHMQLAMPTTLGHWANSYAEMLGQGLTVLDLAYKNVNMCPLGSAAGYGSSFPYPKDFVARELGFESAINVPNTAQNTRTKVDLDFLYATLRVGQALSHFASDVCLFMTLEFGFFALPNELTTGSSIMPQKKNPDGAEILRANFSVLCGNFQQVLLLGNNLMSGYHRDFQLGKKPVLENGNLILQMIEMAKALIQNLEPNTKKLNLAMKPELYATKKVNDLVMQGVSFREAYKKVKQNIED